MAAAAMPNLMQNLAANNQGAISTGLQNAGLTPVGNGAGSTLPGPSGLSTMTPANTAPGAPGMIPTSSPVSSVAGMPNPATPGGSPGALAPTPPGVVPPGTTPPGSVVNGGNGVSITTGTGGTTGSVNPQGQTDTLNQLENQYGAGIGGTIASTLSNLGSNNSTYMQAYEASVAQPNAENLATLDTTLGNQGVSANSSTAAIANADFATGVASQEGLQEQQLLQSQTGESVNLLESLEGVANKNQSTSVVGDIGNVLSAIF
jgi:hypothetical protein